MSTKPLIAECVDCGLTFDASAMVGMGSPPRLVCLKCFDKRMARARDIINKARNLP